MAASLGTIPVYMRVGSCEEHQVGELTVDAEDFDATTIRVGVPQGALSDLLRQVADELEEPA